MAAPIKQDGKWKHRVMIAGKRHTGTFGTKAAAIAWEAECRVVAAKPIAHVKTCLDAFERYEKEVSILKRGHRWEALRLAAFGRMPLASVRMSELNETHIAAWRDERLQSVQGGSVTREMNLLSHVLSTARKEWRWITTSPMTDVARPRSNAHRERRITPAEIEKICLALGWAPDAAGEPQTKQQRIALIFLFAIETAMRASEICGLTASDIEGRVARLRTTKNGSARSVPLSPRALEIWGLVPEGFDVAPASLDAMFRLARRRAGIDDLVFHDSRHEAITRLAKKISVLDLARMVGHKDLKQLLVYYNESADDIAAKL